MHSETVKNLNFLVDYIKIEEEVIQTKAKIRGVEWKVNIRIKKQTQL